MRPQFALPGVPLGSDPKAAAPAAEKTELPPETAAEARPAEARPAEAKPAEAKPEEPAAAAAAPASDLDFHLDAAGKYSARRKYRSAAAEYGAALGFLPAGDSRAVRLLERQGSMELRSGDAAKAQERFASAIEKAKALNVSGEELSKAHLGLGYCLEKAGKIPEAIASYEKAMELTAGKKTRDRISKTISDLKKPAK